MIGRLQEAVNAAVSGVNPVFFFPVVSPVATTEKQHQKVPGELSKVGVSHRGVLQFYSRRCPRVHGQTERKVPQEKQLVT